MGDDFEPVFFHQYIKEAQRFTQKWLNPRSSGQSDKNAPWIELDLSFNTTEHGNQRTIGRDREEIGRDGKSGDVNNQNKDMSNKIIGFTIIKINIITPWFEVETH